MPSLLEVHSTFPDIEQATAVARQLVAERLAACVQLVPGVTSIYHWEGMLRHDSEVLCLFKTSSDQWIELRDRLIALHPYETPEVIAVPVQQSCIRYATWVRESVG